MSEQHVMRQILIEIERDPAISQKKLSEEIGISVGMINWHVKRCVNKGLIKLKQAPARRYLYYLTPEGFSEKAKLTASYLQISFNLFQKGREQYASLFNLCDANKWDHILLLGNTELTELALLVSSQFPQIKLEGLIDETSSSKMRACFSVYSSFDDFKKRQPELKIKAVIVCHYHPVSLTLEETLQFLQQNGLGQDRLLIPGILQ